MKGSAHIKYMLELFAEKDKELINKVQEIIDETAQQVGGLVHRNDMSHDPRIVLGKAMEEGGDLFDWIKDAVKGNLTKVKEMTQLHQIQDVSGFSDELGNLSGTKVGSVVNGHKITQEMIDQCKEAVEQMNQGIKPDLSKFEWTKKAGSGINSKAAPNAPSGPLLKQFAKTCSLDKLNNSGMKAAKGAAIITTVISTGINGYKVYKGEVEAIDAVDNITKDVSCAVVSSYTGAAISILGTTAVIMLGATPAGWVVLGTAFIVGTSTGIGVNCIARKAYDKVPILKLRWWKDKFFRSDKKEVEPPNQNEIDFREQYQNVF